MGAKMVLHVVFPSSCFRWLMVLETWSAGSSPLSVLVRVWVAIAFSCLFFYLFVNYCLFWLSPFRS